MCWSFWASPTIAEELCGESSNLECLSAELTNIARESLNTGTPINDAIGVLVEAGQLEEAKIVKDLYQQRSLDGSLYKTEKSPTEILIESIMSSGRSNSASGSGGIPAWKLREFAKNEFLVGNTQLALDLWAQAIKTSLEGGQRVLVTNIAIDQMRLGLVAEGIANLESSITANAMRSIGGIYFDNGYDINSPALQSLLTSPAVSESFYKSYMQSAIWGHWSGADGAEDAAKKAFTKLEHWESVTDLSVQLAYYWTKFGNFEKGKYWTDQAANAFKTSCPSSQKAYLKTMQSWSSEPLSSISSLYLDLGLTKEAQDALELRTKNDCLQETSPSKWDEIQRVVVLLADGNTKEARKLKEELLSKGKASENDILYTKINKAFAEQLNKAELKSYFEQEKNIINDHVKSVDAGTAYANKIAKQDNLSVEEFDKFRQFVERKLLDGQSLKNLMPQVEPATIRKLMPFFDQEDQIELTRLYINRSAFQDDPLYYAKGVRSRPGIGNLPPDTDEALRLIRNAITLMSKDKAYLPAQALAVWALRLDASDLAQELLENYAGPIESEWSIEELGKEFARLGRADSAIHYFRKLDSLNARFYRTLAALRICLRSPACASN